MADSGSRQGDVVAGGVIRRVTSIRTFQALENEAFRTLWFGMLGSYMAMQMSMIARGYLAFNISGSATALGLVTMARGLPQLFLSPFGGVAADRMDKRKLLVLTQGAMSVLGVTTAVLLFTDLIAIWQLVIIGLLEGTIWAFNMPARQSIVPELVGDDALMNAMALNNSGMNFMRITGPALAGFLISAPWFGLGGVFLLVAAGYAIFVFGLTRLPRTRNVARRPAGSVLAQIAGGFGYIRRNRALLMLLIMAFVPIIFGMSYQTLLPVFQERVLEVGAGELGLLYAFTGVGALIGSLTLASMSAIRRKEVLQIGFGIAFGSVLVLFALSSHFVPALFFILLVGLFGNAYTSLNSTLIMTTSDRAYHGRVMSIYMMTWSLSPLASLPIGALVDAFGAQRVVAVFGLIVVGMFLVLSPARLRASRSAESRQRATAETPSPAR
jgi:MFS family permease